MSAVHVCHPNPVMREGVSIAIADARRTFAPKVQILLVELTADDFYLVTARDGSIYRAVAEACQNSGIPVKCKVRWVTKATFDQLQSENDCPSSRPEDSPLAEVIMSAISD